MTEKNIFVYKIFLLLNISDLSCFLGFFGKNCIFACLLSLKDSTCETRNVFISLQKLFPFSRKSMFRILDIQISWCHDLGSKHSLLMKFGQFISHYKRKNFIKKFYKNCDMKTSSRPFWIFKKLSTTSTGKWNFWSKPLLLNM